MKSADEAWFHESWLGMVQQDGLVVSVPVLTNAGLMFQRGAAAQRAYRERLHPPAGDADEPVRLELPSLDVLLFGLLEFTAADVDSGPRLPQALHVVAADAATSAIVRPTAAIRRAPRVAPDPTPGTDPFASDPFASDPFASDPFATPAEPEPARAPEPVLEGSTDPELSSAALVGRDYLALIWDLADEFGPDAVGRPLDRPDHESTWNYPPAAKFERLLRHSRVPIGLLTNRTQVRLIYAPHGETTGSLTFDLTQMAEVGGRPMLDAFSSLLGRDRFSTQAEQNRLASLLEQSRKQQAEVTERLADQVFDALSVLLEGFESAALRDGSDLLARKVAQAKQLVGTGEVYAGLLTVLLRLVFMLYAEDRGLLPVEHPIYQNGYALLGLFDELSEDQAAHPDAMDRRFGAWSRLLATWRAIHDGVQHQGGDGEAPLFMPPRRGHLFDPDAYPFLEGRAEPAGDGGDLDPEQRANVQVPSLDDGTLHRVLEALLYLREGSIRQRLSYRSLDVEQIGSVYEALMGYDVIRLEHPAVRMRARRAKGVWLSAEELLAVAPAQRAGWLKDEIGLDKSVAGRIAEAVAAATKGIAKSDEREAVLAVLERHAGGKTHGQRAAAGRLVIQPGDERKRTSSHYTPRELTEPVVRRTLAPILRTMEAASGGPPSSEALLHLKIVDPAMGSGAFLVEVVRQLGDHVVAAWQREGRYEEHGSLFAAQLGDLSAEARPGVGETDEADPVIAARRLVAQRCVYGVDKNPYAVNLAKLSLWLVTLSRSLPFTFVDHALRQGDSLVGLSLAQVQAFDWRIDEGAASGKAAKKGKAAKQIDDPVLARIVATSLERATRLRGKIVELARADGEDAVLEREALLGQAKEALEDARLAADLCLSAFFAASKDKERLAERTRRLDLLTSYLGARERGEEGAEELRTQLEGLRAGALGRQTPFHWMLEFPEVFWEGRPDPLAGGKANRVAYFDAVVGNPPFLGGTDITARIGSGYTQWLYVSFPPTRNRADLCAYFLRQSTRLIGPHGAVGLVVTNTIGQGDTRTGGLAYELANGAKIYDATVDLQWPAPGAAVTVCVIHLAHGTVAGEAHEKVLRRVEQQKIEAAIVGVINSRLASRAERGDPVSLKSNQGMSYLGSKIYGQGFLLTPEERETLVGLNSRNAEIIKPYMGGEEVNSNPDQGFDRYVIDFGDRDFEQAEAWPELMAIVRERVQPERVMYSGGSDGRRLSEYWWQFFRSASALYSALANLQRCLVTARVTKHLCFSWQPNNRVINEMIVGITVEQDSAMAILQSRGYAPWCWGLSSTMRNAGLRYSPTDCFQNFPFPAPDPRTEHPRLEPLGAALDAQRSAFMLDHQVGLTTTYNLLLGFDLESIRADPTHKHHAPATDPRLAELRELHLAIDRAVLDTYAENLDASKDPKERELAGLFRSIEVPPYLDPRLPNLEPAQKAALERFNDEVLDALMALNEVRAAQERRGGK
jgi:hypothetical protein